MMVRFGILSILPVLFFVLLFCVNSGYAAADPNTVAAWDLDEGSGKIAKDVSGNGHDGELREGAEWSKDGKFRGAVEFDGVEAHIEIAHDDSLNLEEAFSIEAWVNVTPGANQGIMQKQGAGGSSERNYIFNIRPEGFLRGSFSSGGSQHDFDGPTILEAGKWYHVAATYDGKVGRIYVDGELDGETDLDFPLEANDASLFLGKAGGTGGARLNGLLDEVRLSRVARTQEEIKELMGKGLAAALAVEAGDKLTTTWGAVRLPVLDF